MYYGDEQANYTGMRASYGPFGGMMAAGAQAQMGYGGGGQGYSPDGSPLQQIGGMVRPLGYMPPARVYVSASGQYVQPGGVGRSFGTMIGFNEPPRNISSYDYRMYGASDFADRAGMGTFAGVSTGVGLAAGMAMAPMGAAAGGVVGAGVGGLAGSLFGPLGTLAGAKVGAAVGSFVGGIGASFVPSIATAGVSDVLNQQMQVRSHLENSSFRFATSSSAMSDPRFASGMSTQARGAVAEHLTSMDVKDPFLDMGELTKILKGATSMGLMNNTQTTEEFKKKFKDITENVKTVARVLNTTLEDGLKTMKDFRGIGITDANEVGRLTMQSQAQGKMAGKTAGEMVEVGMQGAEMMRGTGISMSIGFKAAQMNLSAVRAARDANVLSQEAVAQAGGEEALAQRMTASGVGFAQSSMGRGNMAAFYGGNGTMDTAAMYKGMAGGMSMPEMAMAAAKNLSSPKALLEFQANQAKLVSEAGKAFGGEGLEMMRLGNAMTQAKFLNQNTGVSVEVGLRNTLLNQGLSQSEVDMSVARIQNADKEYSSRQKAIGATRAQEQAEGAYQNFFLTRIGSKAGDVIKGAYSTITNPVGRQLDTFRESARDWVETQAYGLQRYDVSGTGYQESAAGENVKQLLAGKGSITTVGEMLGKQSINLDADAMIGRSTGSALYDRRDSLLKNFGISTTSRFKGGAGSDPQIILRDSIAGNYKAGISFDDLRKVSSTLNTVGGITDEETEAFKKDSTTYAGTLRSIQQKARNTDLSGIKSYGDLFGTLTGKTIDKVSREEAMAIREATQGTAAGKLFDTLDIDRKAAGDAYRGVDVSLVKKEEANYKVMKQTLSNALGSKDPISDEAYQLIVKSQNEKDPQAKQDLLFKASGLVSKSSGLSTKQFFDGIDAVEKSGGFAENLKEANQGLSTLMSARGIIANRDQFLSKANEAGSAKEKQMYTTLGNAAMLGGSAFSSAVLENKESLEKNQMGNVVEQAKSLQSAEAAISEYEQAKKSGDKDVIKTKGARLSAVLANQDKIKGFGLSKGDAGSVIGMLDSGGKSKDVIDTLYKNQQVALSEQSGSVAAGGPAGPKTTTAGSGQEAFATQININQQILMNLQAMQQILNGGKRP
jgi:hypothetical protein